MSLRKKLCTVVALALAFVCVPDTSVHAAIENDVKVTVDYDSQTVTFDTNIENGTVYYAISKVENPENTDDMYVIGTKVSDLYAKDKEGLSALYEAAEKMKESTNSTLTVEETMWDLGWIYGDGRVNKSYLEICDDVIDDNFCMSEHITDKAKNNWLIAELGNPIPFDAFDYALDEDKKYYFYIQYMIAVEDEFSSVSVEEVKEEGVDDNDIAENSNLYVDANYTLSEDKSYATISFDVFTGYRIWNDDEYAYDMIRGDSIFNYVAEDRTTGITTTNTYRVENNGAYWFDVATDEGYASCSVSVQGIEFVGYAYYGDWQYKLNEENDGIIITGYTGEDTKLIVPDKIDGIPVTDIGRRAFDGDECLKEIVLPESIVNIGFAAFRGCTELTKITIPNYVMNMETCIFEGCVNLKEVVLPEDMEEIPTATFSECTALTSITIPNGVTVVGERAFQYCESLEEVVLPESIVEIEEEAFYECINLKSVNIPNGVKHIGSYAFSGCTELTSIDIPNSVLSIGHKVFEHCDSLKEIVLPESIVSMGERVFYGCDDLINIVLTEGITRIDSYALADCNIESIVIPESVTEIAAFAFSGCSNLKSIYIPCNVTEVDIEAFSQCNNLMEIRVSEDNMIYDSRDNCNAIIETDTNTLYIGCAGTVVPNSVIKIGENAFKCCSGAFALTIPEGVVEISDFAFYMSGLTSISIPESVTYIGPAAFSESSLTSISIPDSVASMNNIFAFCYDLTDVKLPNSIMRINGFHECPSLTNITIPEGAKYIDSDAFYYCSGLISITIPANVTSIGENAFVACPTTMIVYADEGSVAAEYAKSKGFTVMPISDSGIQTPPTDSTEVENTEGTSTETSNPETGRTEEASTELSNPEVERTEEVSTETNKPETETTEADSTETSKPETGSTETNNTAGITTEEKTTEQPNVSNNSPVVGTSMEISGIIYEITKCNDVTKEVEYIGPISSKKTSVTIPATVKINGETYKVTSVADEACKNYKKLKSVTIGKNVTKIGKNAFCGCKNLKKITIKSTVLKSVGKNAIKGINKKATIKVPKKQYSKYKKLFKSKTGYKKSMKIKK